MTCPPELSELLTTILTLGLVRIRDLGWSGQAERCAIEADHIHNLPSLLTDYAPQRLWYYWDFERPYFCSRSEGADLGIWGPVWDELAALIAPSLTPKDSKTP